MNISLNLKQVSGSITVPASKSMSQRICAAALLHCGTTTIYNFGKSADELAALGIIKSLGAVLSQSNNTINIKSDGRIKGNVTIHCGESGLAARLFTPIAALSNMPIRIEGKGSLLKRPMGFFADVLQKLNVSLSDFEAYIPFTIQGPLCAKNTTVDGSLSSQFISGLLFAFAQSATEKIILEVEGLVSKPYIDLSLEVLALFGKKIKHQRYQIFEIDPLLFSYQETISLSIESDWSSAAFWVAAATIKGSVSLLGLNRNSNQADKIILEIAERVGAKIKWDENVLHVSAGNLNAFETDLNDAPDLFPVLSVLAACCDGQSKISGLHRLIHKESNRAESITQLLSQLGVPFIVEQDTLIIQGTLSFNAIEYHCPNDHRMAMAAALANMHSEGEIKIVNAECVYKSYPDFWNELEMQKTF